MAKTSKTYGLAEARSGVRIPAPNLPYQPRDPKRYRPPIALIGCGGISQLHLQAYKKARYDVVALCDLTEAKAERRRAEFFPRAQVYTDYRQVLKRDDVEVVDIATHPAERVRIIRDALNAGKHVLSQKPFVLDLDVGESLVELAEKRGVRLAVNQNGRWAPHFSYLRQAIDQGLIGDVMGAHLGVHWDHNWTAGTPFDRVRHLVLYDFAIHWFDIVTVFMGGRAAEEVYATLTHAPNQRSKPPLLGQALIRYRGAQSTLAFDASTPVGPLDQTFVAGTKGVLRSTGPSLTEQSVALVTAKGRATPRLKGSWFPDGFHGTMAELLCAIEEGRAPVNDAGKNLLSLALCFAAARSADTGRPQVPGRVRRMARQ